MEVEAKKGIVYCKVKKINVVKFEHCPKESCKTCLMVPEQINSAKVDVVKHDNINPPTRSPTTETVISNEFKETFVNAFSVKNELLGDAVKEKIDHILHLEILTPTQLADAYLEFKRNGKYFGLPVSKATATKGIRLIIAKAFFILIKGRSCFFTTVNKNNLAKFQEKIKKLKNEYDNIIISVEQSLSKKTQQKLNNSYDRDAITKICEAIADFKEMFSKQEKAEDLVNMFSTKDTITRLTKEIDSLEYILNGNPLLPDNIKETLESLKQRTKSVLQLKKIIDVEIDPVKLLMIYHNRTIPNTLIAPAPYKPIEWYLRYLFALSLFVVKKPVGSPQNTFLEAMKIVIYQILTKNKDEKKNKNWKRRLTAEIISESLNLPKTTPKSIEHTLRKK